MAQFLLISPVGNAYAPKGIIQHYDSPESAEAARDRLTDGIEYEAKEA